MIELDEFLNDFLGRDGAIVVGIERFFELLTEELGLHQVAGGADLGFVFEEFLQQLGGDILVFQAAHFGQEAFVENADVGLG